MVCTPVCARVFLLATFVAKNRLRKFEFRAGGPSEARHSCPRERPVGLVPAPEIFASGRGSARRPVLEN